MNILIIDDEQNTSDALHSQLLALITGIDSVVSVVSPKDGINLMNHSFDLVFIDYKFPGGNNALTGAEVGRRIREKFPLASLILITAYGKDSSNIEDYISVGFDAFYEKRQEGDSMQEEDERLIKTVILAMKRSQDRLKSKFDEFQLYDVRERLNKMEAVIKAGYYGVEQCAVAVSLLEAGKKIDDFDDKLIREILTNRKRSSSYKYEGTIPILTNAAFNTYLKVYDREGKFVAPESALKVRQLFKENPLLWSEIRKKHETVRSFIKNFDLNK